MTILQQTISKKWFFCNGSFRYVSTLALRVFRSQNTQILRYLLMPRWERSRVVVSEQFNSNVCFALKVLGMYFIIYYNDTFSKTSFAMEVWGMCLPYVKVFSTASMKFFFVRPQNIRILLFLVKLVWERKGQCQSKTFPKTFFLHWKF